jgi:hypothetical protein
VLGQVQGDAGKRFLRPIQALRCLMHEDSKIKLKGLRDTTVAEHDLKSVSKMAVCRLDNRDFCLRHGV